MQLLFKLLNIIAVFIFLTGFAFADSTGIVFDWQPFVVNDSLRLDHPSGNIIPKKPLFPKEVPGKFNTTEEFLHSDLKTINNSSDSTAKKSALRKIKVTFSTGFMLPGDEIHLRDKDEKLSRTANILSSILRNPSQETAVETLKLIEPQVNFGFEF